MRIRICFIRLAESIRFRFHDVRLGPEANKPSGLACRGETSPSASSPGRGLSLIPANAPCCRPPTVTPRNDLGVIELCMAGRKPFQEAANRAVVHHPPADTFHILRLAPAGGMDARTDLRIRDLVSESPRLSRMVRAYSRSVRLRPGSLFAPWRSDPKNAEQTEEANTPRRLNLFRRPNP